MAVPTDTLTIEGFAGIKSLEMKIKPFTLLTGPQGVGKSVTAKVLYFLRSLAGEFLAHAAKEARDTKEYQDFCRGVFGAIFSPQVFKRSFRLALSTPGGQFSVEFTAPKRFKVNVPQHLTEHLDTLREKTLRDLLSKSKLHPSDQGDAMMSYAKRHMGKTFCPSLQLIPAGRAFFSYLEQNIYSVMDSGAWDPFIKAFGRDYQQLRLQQETAPFLVEKLSKAQQQSSALAAKILRGEYRREGKKDYLAFGDKRMVELRYCSSGQQESLPLTLFLLNHISNGGPWKPIPTALTIEEPEAHLHPDAQRAVVELIACAFSQSKSLSQVFITTHSPYLLGAVNLLLDARRLHSKKLPAAKKKKLEQLVPEALALGKDTVAAYLMEDGKCQDLIDPGTGLIGENSVDAALNRLGDDHEALLALED